MKRQRDDSAGPKRGELGKYIDHPRVTRRGNTGWSDEGAGTSPEGQGAYSPDDDNPLRQGTDIQFSWGTRDIFDDVNANSDVRGDSVNPNSGPIKFGINRKQGK
jgi:hypothetical protein